MTHGSENTTPTPRRIRDMPVIEVRIEPNVQGTHLLWRVSASDGTKASGFAKSHADAMRDAAEFAEAMAQPRIGGLGTKPSLRVVGSPDDAG